jgi:3-phenylpropionate/trans-cinnamate dioxygenase ferredoxin reductase subunit
MRAPVAARLAGKPAPYDKLPWFWSDQGDLRVQMCGLAQESDDVVLRGSPESGRFTVLRYCGDRLTAAETFNHPAEHMAIRRILAAGGTLTREQAADPAFKLASAMPVAAPHRSRQRRRLRRRRTADNGRRHPIGARAMTRWT